MAENKNNTGLKVDALFGSFGAALRAKHAIISAIKKNGGHGQARTVPGDSLKGHDCSYRIEQKRSK